MRAEQVTAWITTAPSAVSCRLCPCHPAAEQAAGYDHPGAEQAAGYDHPGAEQAVTVPPGGRAGSRLCPCHSGAEQAAGCERATRGRAGHDCATRGRAGSSVHRHYWRCKEPFRGKGAEPFPRTNCFQVCHTGGRLLQKGTHMPVCPAGKWEPGELGGTPSCQAQGPQNCHVEPTRPPRLRRES